MARAPEVTGRPMSRFEHWVAEAAIRHQAAVRAAKMLEPSGATGRSPAEADISRLTIAFIQHLHKLPELVLKFGAPKVFEAPDAPLTDAELAEIRA